jgi:FtsZ-binding cell division protein ZapB
VSEEVFKQLTDEKYLPRINPKSALELLQMECKILEGKENNNVDDGELSNLQKRCAEAFAENASTVDLEESGVVLRNLPPLVLSKIISHMVSMR